MSNTGELPSALDQGNGLFATKKNLSIGLPKFPFRLRQIPIYAHRNSRFAETGISWQLTETAGHSTAQQCETELSFRKFPFSSHFYWGFAC